MLFAFNYLILRGNFGGRTRARTWDPLIKSQLLYQLSYAPGLPERFASGGGRVAKAAAPVQQPRPASDGPGITGPDWRKPASAPRAKGKPPGGPGGSLRRRSRGAGKDRRQCDSGSVRRPAVARAPPQRPPRLRDSMREPALLAVVKALVERLRRIGEALQARGRASVIASARPRSRSIRSTGCARCGARSVARRAASCGRRAAWRDRGSRSRPPASSSPARA